MGGGSERAERDIIGRWRARYDNYRGTGFKSVKRNAVHAKNSVYGVYNRQGEPKDAQRRDGKWYATGVWRESDGWVTRLRVPPGCTDF